MTEFAEFAEFLERICSSSWRSAVGRDNEELISEVSTVLFSMEDKGEKWEFSFALRRFGRWSQAKREIAKVEYDPMDPPPAGVYDPKRSQSPQNKASELATEMLLEVAEKLK